MIGFIQWLVYGHVHKYTTIKETTIVDENGSRLRSRFYVRCDHCGCIKTYG